MHGLRVMGLIAKINTELTSTSFSLVREIFVNMLPDPIGVNDNNYTIWDTLGKGRLQPGKQDLVLDFPLFVSRIYSSRITITFKKKPGKNNGINNKLMEFVGFNYRFNLLLPVEIIGIVRICFIICINSIRICVLLFPYLADYNCSVW